MEKMAMSTMLRNRSSEMFTSIFFSTIVPSTLITICVLLYDNRLIDFFLRQGNFQYLTHACDEVEC